MANKHISRQLNDSSKGPTKSGPVALSMSHSDSHHRYKCIKAIKNAKHQYNMLIYICDPHIYTHIFSCPSSTYTPLQYIHNEAATDNDFHSWINLQINQLVYDMPMK